MTTDPDTIRAFVDGELDDLAAARLARAMETDKDLARMVEQERELRARLSAHFDPVLDEPLPARLTAPLEEARKVTSLDQARTARQDRGRGISNARLWRWGAPALAASLVLALLVPVMMKGDPVETIDGAIYARGSLAQALDNRLVVDQDPGADTRILLSFASNEGAICRGFAREDLSGIACRDERGWEIRLREDGVGADTTEFRQAGSPAGAVFAAAQEMAAGPALDAEGERRARERNWRVE